MRSPSSSDDAKTVVLKKGPWSHEEDEKLKSYISRYGIWNWSHMPKYAGLSRSGKSCRLRWMNYLKPNVKKGKFSKEEEEIILHFHSLLGNRWSAIASKLPGRSDNDIKNYWHTRLKKRVANHTLMECTTIEKHDIQKNYVNDRFGSLFVQTASEDDNSSSSSSSSKDHEDGIIVDRYDICSPGTVNDLQCFWKQVFQLENYIMELGTTRKDTSSSTVEAGDIFPYSYI